MLEDYDLPADPLLVIAKFFGELLRFDINLTVDKPRRRKSPLLFNPTLSTI
jgi:hypothetical protein